MEIYLCRDEQQTGPYTEAEVHAMLAANEIKGTCLALVGRRVGVAPARTGRCPACASCLSTSFQRVCRPCPCAAPLPELVLTSMRGPWHLLNRAHRIVG